MSLPRLMAVAQDSRAVARLLRGALRHEIEVVPLSEPPKSIGQHLLDVEVAGEGVVTLLADLAGAATPAGQPLRVRPVTRPQMASLFSLIERLDEPSHSDPPPSNGQEFRPDDDEEVTLVEVGRPPLASAPRIIADRFARSATPSVLPWPSATRHWSSKPPANLPALPFGPTSTLIGRLIAGKYELEAPLGSGVSATVFKALHVDLQREVAVKILHEQKRGNMQFVKRFKAEARAASKLEHPNVVQVLDFGQEDDGLLYLVMELLTGRSLESMLTSSGVLSPHAAVRFAIQACGALAFAHDLGIVHRDVKPENIMIVQCRDDDGNAREVAKVCDFGLAKLREAGSAEELTTAGMLCGSPAYMSPEQSRGDPIDGRSDIYSLAVTIFESLTATMPHEAGDLAELFSKKTLQAARTLSSLLPRVDPRLDRLVARALSVDPTQRPATARVMREELREVLAGLPTEHESSAVAE